MKYYNRERNILTGLYWQLIHIAGDSIEVDFLKANLLSKKKQKKIRIEISKFCDENIVILSDKNKDEISPQTKLSDIFTFLNVIKNQSTKTDQSRREDWIDFASTLNERTRNAITRLFDDDIYSSELNDLKIVDGKVKWALERSDSFEQILYLFNPIFSQNYNSESLHSDPEISKTDDGYLIEFIQSDFDEPSMTYINERVASLSFSNMELETACFDYTMPRAFSYEPWTAIYKYLFELENKNDALGEAFLNDNEKTLLPLSDFSPFNNFNGWHVENVCNGNIAAVELFKSLAIEAGNQKVADLTEKYLIYIKDYHINVSDSDNPDESHLNYKIPKEEKRLSKKLTEELKKVESEPLFRLILKKIKEAASEYPIKIERDVSSDRLNDARTHIIEQMREKGFDGEYPHFKKRSLLKGIKVIEINGQPVIVCNEKNMVSCIDCFEDFCFEQIIVSYAVSTVFLKNNQLDLYNKLNGDSGFFIDKYRRRARYIMFNNYINDLPNFNLQKSIDVAVKTSQCEKLTKTERKEYTPVGPGKYGLSVLAIIWLIAGVAFGMLMCIGMFLIGLIIGIPMAAFSSETTVYEFARDLAFDFPWHWMFVFGSVSFGGIMFLFSLIGWKKG